MRSDLAKIGEGVIDVGNRLFKTLTNYTVSGHLSTNASDIEVLPIFWLNESSRKNRNQSATVKLKNVQISVHTLPVNFLSKNLEILNLSNSLTRSNEVKFEEKEFINDLCSSLLKLRKLNLNHWMVVSSKLSSKYEFNFMLHNFWIKHKKSLELTFPEREFFASFVCQTNAWKTHPNIFPKFHFSFFNKKGELSK